MQASALEATLPTSETVLWDLWYPNAAATGLPFARGRLNPMATLWVHSAPETLAVDVRGGDGSQIAHSEDVTRSGERFPMTRLWLEGDQVRREDRWPTAADIGSLVLLPGGEVGILLDWWNASDGSEWRWHIQFHNHV